MLQLSASEAESVRIRQALRLKKKVVFVLSAFGDESSDEKHQRVFAVGALFGEQHQWDALEEKWLARMPKGVHFHAADCESDHGDFARFAHQENKSLYKDLTQLLCASGVLGHADVIDLIGRKKYMGDLLPETEYLHCFAKVIVYFAHRAAMYIPREQVKFTFDRRLETEVNSVALHDYLSHLPEWEDHEYLHKEFGFASREIVGVQAADLFVYEMMKHLDNQIGPVKRPTRKSFIAIEQCGRFGADFRVDDYFLALREHVDRRESDGLLSRRKYADWLERYNTTDSLQNRLRFFIHQDAIARATGDTGHFQDVRRL